jgi:hypothetical protein
MRRNVAVLAGIAGTFAMMAFAACNADQPGQVTTPAAPTKAAVQDLEGLPDLVVDTEKMRTSWLVVEETFRQGQCSVEEGNIPTGTHRSLRFSVLINNAGDADLFVGDPLKHMDPNGDGNFADQDGLFEFASCHAHFHFRNYATYELIRINADGTLGSPVQSRKRGFCMLDTTPMANGTPGEQPKARYYSSCGNLTISGNQGISTNFGDEYFKSLPGQLFLLTDPNEPVGPGKYIIRVTANPPFAPRRGEVCPVKDAKGFCHMFAEKSYDNNVGEITIEIPNRVGKTGTGPGAATYNGEKLDPWHHPEGHAAGH